MTEQTIILETLRKNGEIAPYRLDYWATVKPDQTCVYYGETGETLTYAEMSEVTTRIARNMAKNGIIKGSRISVFTTNPLLSAVAMFAIWKAGGVYSPINFSYSGRLLSYQLNDTQPELVIVDSTLVSTLEEALDTLPDVTQVIVFDSSATSVVGKHESKVAESFKAWSILLEETDGPQADIHYSDAANIVYTSGTTGYPKGVLQTHRWMNQYTLLMRNIITQDDVVYNDLPMYHVGGAIANVVRAVWAGCEVAIWDKFSASDFWNRIRERHVTAAILLDVMIPWLMKAPETDTDRENSLNKVHMQPLPLHHTAVARRFGIDFVTAGFGQTESGAPLGLLMEECSPTDGTPETYYRGLTREEIKEQAEAAGLHVTEGSAITEKGVMGIPLPHFEATILDEQDKPCFVGEVGELAFRPRVDHLMMTEYINKPEATEAAWSGGWFHTGDTAIVDNDGLFRFVDRIGDRIRVRGENLSSFQVEDLLNQHPHVQFSAVFSIPSEEGDEDDIVAYVVPTHSGALADIDLRRHTEQTMPKFMRPKYVRIVDEIPRTPTNKIEKYKLRQAMREELNR